MAYADGTKVHVQVQDETRFALKKRAKANKISMNLAINNAIEEYLNNEKRDKRMQIIVPTTTKEMLEEEASEKGISVNELVNRAFKEHFSSEGLKKEQTEESGQPKITVNKEQLEKLSQYSKDMNVSLEELVEWSIRDFLKQLSFDYALMPANEKYKLTADSRKFSICLDTLNSLLAELKSYDEAETRTNNQEATNDN